MGGAECHHTQRRPQPRAGGQRLGAISAISLSAVFLRSAFNSRCTIECCFLQNCSGCLSLNRPTMASAVNCGSAASQPSIVATCGSSIDGMRTRFM